MRYRLTDWIGSRRVNALLDDRALVVHSKFNSRKQRRRSTTVMNLGKLNRAEAFEVKVVSECPKIEAVLESGANPKEGHNGDSILKEVGLTGGETACRTTKK